MTKLPSSRTEYVGCGDSRVLGDVWDKDGDPVQLTIVGKPRPPSDQDPDPRDVPRQGDPVGRSAGDQESDLPELPEISSGYYAALEVSDVTGRMVGPGIDMVFTPDFARRLGVRPHRQAVVWSTAQVVGGRLMLDLPQGFTASASGDITFVIGLGED